MGQVMVTTLNDFPQQQFGSYTEGLIIFKDPFFLSATYNFITVNLKLLKQKSLFLEKYKIYLIKNKHCSHYGK